MQSIKRLFRVILERVFSRGPHPWGLKVTVVQLFKRDDFWNSDFVNCDEKVRKESCYYDYISCYIDWMHHTVWFIQYAAYSIKLYNNSLKRKSKIFIRHVLTKDQFKAHRKWWKERIKISNFDFESADHCSFLVFTPDSAHCHLSIEVRDPIRTQT